MTRALLALLVTGLLAGCGFHLAGSRPLPEALANVYIQVVTPYRVSEPPLEVALRTALQRRGALVTGEGDTRTVIKLIDLVESRRVVSLGTDGKALEFELTTRVRYQVTRGTQILVGPDELQVSRDYSFNAQQVLAKDAEEQVLRDFIQGELAELLLLRIETRLNRQQDAGPEQLPGGTLAQ